ncbi:MAG: polysaccharide biosynthesis/export family protein [Sphingorhabdus sp.]
MRLFAAILSLLILSACAGGPKADLPINPVGLKAPDAQSQIYADQNFRLSPFDEIQINVFRVKELSGKYKIDPSGHLSMPLIGSVEVVGMNATALAEKLTRLYGRNYLENPDITIQVQKSQGQNLTVEGSVNNPGIYQIDGRTTLIGAIAIARGLDDQTANAKRVVVFRQIDGETYAAAFNLKEVRAGLVPNPHIYGGDIVVVDGSNLRQTYLDLLRTLPLLSLFTRI